MPAGPAARVTARLYTHAVLGRCFFYLPVLVHHLVGGLEEAGIARDHMASMSILALFSVGIALAEYPSGVFADWAGRGRALIAGSLLYAVGLLLYLIPASPLAFAVGQLMIGVGTAFRSSADTALLHAWLESSGEGLRYGAALARLRLWNLVGLIGSSAIGGALYTVSPALVFGLSAAAAVASALPLLGLKEQRETHLRRGYAQVLRESLHETRRNLKVQALVLLGGAGTTYFLFAFWATQAYLVETGTAPHLMGYAVALLMVLQAATMPVSARIGSFDRTNERSFPVLLVGLPAAFLVVAATGGAGLWLPGALALIAASACQVLYRNAVNVRLQALVPDSVRASVVSLESWVGSLWYMVFFPLGGWLIDTGGVGSGYAGIAVFVAATTLPFLSLARRRGVWRAGSPHGATGE